MSCRVEPAAIRSLHVRKAIGVLSSQEEVSMSAANKAVMSVRGNAQGASRAPSEFSLEFGSAMLMAPRLHQLALSEALEELLCFVRQNLALRSTGKRKCLEQDVLPMAMKLMECLASIALTVGS